MVLDCLRVEICAFLPQSDQRQEKKNDLEAHVSCIGPSWCFLVYRARLVNYLFQNKLDLSQDTPDLSQDAVDLSQCAPDLSQDEPGFSEEMGAR